jgi:phosphoribosyl 1,2-cyclic phosphate phosphodiesterase
VAGKLNWASAWALAATSILNSFHAPGSEALIYSISRDGSTILYATDTAVLSEDAWKAFKGHDLKFDLIVFDHTYGPEDEGTDHLSAHQVAEHIDRMRADGLLSSGSIALATHIAHEGNPAHTELSQFASEHGYEIAYDGLEISI